MSAQVFEDQEGQAARLILAHEYVVRLVEWSFDQPQFVARLNGSGGIWDPVLQIVHAHEAAIEQIGEQLKYTRVLSEVAAAAQRMLPDDNRSVP